MTRLLLTFVLLLFLTHAAMSQNAVVQETDGLLIPLQSGEVKLTDNEVIARFDGGAVTENLAGMKDWTTSHSSDQLLVTNYPIPSTPQMYDITGIVLDEAGNETNRFSLAAEYDMPHPLFAVNSLGVAAAFDPVAFEVQLFKDSETLNVPLRKGAERIRERTSYIASANGDFYIISTLGYAGTDSDEAGCVLYRVTAEGEISFVPVELSQVFSLYIDSEGNILAGGEEKVNSQYINKLYKFSPLLERLVESTGRDARAVIETPGGYAVAGLDGLVLLDAELRMTYDLSYDEPLVVKGLTQNEEGQLILLAINSASQYYLHTFSENLRERRLSELPSIKHTHTKLKTFSEKVIIHTDNKTIIYQ